MAEVPQGEIEQVHVAQQYPGHHGHSEDGKITQRRLH